MKVIPNNALSHLQKHGSPPDQYLPSKQGISTQTNLCQFQIPGPRSSVRSVSPAPPSTGSPTGARSSRPGVRATGSRTPRHGPLGPQHHGVPPPRPRLAPRLWTRLLTPGSFRSPRYRFRPARATGLDRRSHERHGCLYGSEVCRSRQRRGHQHVLRPLHDSGSRGGGGGEERLRESSP